MLSPIGSLAALAFLLSALPVAAQETLKDRAADEILDDDHKRYLTLTSENDLYGGGGDRNYTNGVRLDWFEVGRKPPGVTRELGRTLPFVEINETSSVAYSLGHNLYTPDAVGSPLQEPRDRPWAAFLYGSMSMVTLAENHLDEYEVTLGVVGPMALGKTIQKNWHEVIGSEEPRGWHNQLSNEPGLVFSWQRRWPQAWETDLDGLFLSFTPHAGAALGNIYTYANTGGTVKFSPQHRRWADKPISVRPAIPSTGYFPQASPLGWELFLGLEGRAVARNIFLDGNTFSSSHSVDKYPLVADASAGVAFTLGPTRLSYTLVYRTREFLGQDDASLFGAISLGYNF